MDAPFSEQSLLRLPDFWRLLGVSSCATLASRGLAMVVGYQVFAITGSEFSLGMLGLIEAIPALSLALYGGHIADRHDRRGILRVTLLSLVICTGAIAALAHFSGALSLTALYTLVFLAGIARGFAEPAAAALEAQVTPPHLLVKSSPWFASTWLTSSVVGPALAGIGLKEVGPSGMYAAFAVLYAVAWIGASWLQPRPLPPRSSPEESIWQSVAEGVKYVTRHQVLLGSMALDLVAVLFGGAIALLPAFAAKVLKVDEAGLGLLVAAPYAGALLTMLLAMWRPPMRWAGASLLLAVAGFGVAMIVFAFSTSFYLSLAALFISGICDGVSVVIRRSIVRIMSPDHLRGRIAAVSMVFIGSSNELGALESGLVAAWLGLARSVWLGGLVTLVVVAATAFSAPELRRLRLDLPRDPEHPRPDVPKA
jgi:MFS family permease